MQRHLEWVFMMDIKVMLLYGLLQLLRKVKHFTHRHLREMFVEYLAGLSFDNRIGLGPL